MNEDLKKLPLFTVHAHPSSLDSGDSIENFIRSAAVDFNRKALAVTDHGTLGAIIESVEYSKKLKKEENIDITIVPGVEIYLLPMPWDDTKYPYYHLTIHFKDFESYLVGCKLSRPTYDRSIFKGGELKPLMTWEELASLSGKVTFGSGCILSPVNRPVLKGRRDIAEKYLEIIQEIAGPDHLFMEIMPYEVSKNWNSKTKIFEPIQNECIPSGKLQVECNEWIFHLSKKYNLPIVMSEDAHYSKPENKIIQDCVDQGTLIYTYNGICPIENVSVGDLVLTHRGRFKRVTAVKGGYTNKSKVDIYYGHTKSKVTLTEDHLVLTKSRKNKNSFYKNRTISTEGRWKSASKLNSDDLVFLPKIPLNSISGMGKTFINLTEYSSEVVDGLSLTTNKMNGMTKSIKTMIPIDYKISYVLGLFLGDGYSKDSRSISLLVDNSNVFGIDCIEHFAKTAESVLKRDKDLGNGSVRSYKIYSGILGRWFFHNFYDKDLKTFNLDFFKSMDENQQDFFIKGLFDADGRKNRDQVSIALSSPNAISLLSYWSLSRNLYFKFDFTEPKATKRNGVISKTKATFAIYYSGEYKNKFYKIIKSDRYKINNFAHLLFEDETGFWKRISKVLPSASNKPVYDLEVEDDHTFITENFVVHNCRLSKDGGWGWKMADANCLHSNEWLYNEFKRLHPNVVNEKVFTEWIYNSYKMLSNFKGFDSKFKHALPKIEIGGKPRDLSEDEAVTHVIKKIMDKKRISLSDPIYADRLKKEIDALAYNGKLNILPYFMVLEDVVNWCKKNNVLVGPGRGSGAGSLLNYALGITSVDPIKEDLSFERFFDVSRVEEGLADIDMDFSDRTKVIEYIKEKYGNRFSYLGIGSTFKTKSAIKDIDRLLNGEVRPDTEAVCKTIPQSPQGVSEMEFLRGYTDADGVYHEGELEINIKLQDYLRANTQVTGMLFKMTDIVRQMSKHASGVLIADRPIEDFIPIMKINGETTTQLLPKWVEKCGGIKYDILGVNTLEDIRVAINIIKKRKSVSIDPWNVDDTIDMWQSVWEDPITVFQLHTQTVRPGLVAMKPRSLQEGAILTSVYRPGATDAPSDENPNITMEKIFIGRWQGTRETKLIHPDLENILGPTKGVLVYQESLMRIANELGGLTMLETQKLRKAVSKKASDDLIVLLNKVQDHLINVRGWTKNQAESLCNQMKASGRYSFNKAHAISYMYIARACAYLKWKYPSEWWTAVLSNASKDDLKIYWPHVSKFVQIPDINRSTDQFQIIDKADGSFYILSPLSLIDGLGPAVLAAILANVPYTSLEDFMTRVDRRVVNKKVMLRLIFSGCIDFMFKGKTEIERIQEYFELKAKLEGKKNKEELPEEYRNITALKKELIKKSVYKVYNTDLLKASMSKMESLNLIRKSGPMNMVSTLVHSNKKYNGALFINAAEYEKIMIQSDQRRFAIVGYVSDMKEKKYQGNKKSMMQVHIELEDKLIETVKWPDYGSDHHGVSVDIKENACIIVMSKRENKDQAYIDTIIPIEKITF